MYSIAHIAPYIKPTVGGKVTFVENGNTDKIIEEILVGDKRAKGKLGDLPKSLKGRTRLETARNIWRFIKENIEYKEDPHNYQYIQQPNALLQNKKGDCKSYSIFIAEVLRSLGIPYKYRFTAYEKGAKVTHVYVIVPRSGNNYDEPILIDAVWKSFNDQKPYKHKKDFSPMTNIHHVSGIGQSAAGQLDIGDPAKLTEGHLEILIAKQRMEIERSIVSGIGRHTMAEGYDRRLMVLNDALEVIGDKNLPVHRQMIEMEVIEDQALRGSYDRIDAIGLFGSAKRKAQRKARRKLKRQETGKTGFGRFLQGATKKIGQGLKGIAKLATAPLRLAAKGILEVMLPKAGPGFLYLFLKSDKGLTPAGKKKRADQIKIRDFITKTMGMKNAHFMGIIKNGIMKEYKKTPEQVLRDKGIGIEGVGAVPGAIFAAVKKLISTIAKIFKKKAPITESAPPTPGKDFESSEAHVEATRKLGSGLTMDEYAQDDFDRGGRTKKWS